VLQRYTRKVARLFVFATQQQPSRIFDTNQQPIQIKMVRRIVSILDLSCAIALDARSRVWRSEENGGKDGL
jgi:hypothetical protein